MRARPWAPRHCRVRHRLSSEPTPPPIIDQGADVATTTADNIQIIGGVDTHQDLHTAAVVSHDGTVLGTASFSTTRAGYLAHPETLKHRPCRSHAVNVTMPADGFEGGDGCWW